MALVSTDQGCEDSGHSFLLIIWKKMQIKAASYLFGLSNWQIFKIKILCSVDEGAGHW